MMADTYENVELYIDGRWQPSSSAQTLNILNPATEEVLGHVAHASIDDLDMALVAAEKGFHNWRNVPAFERYKLMRDAADIFRKHANETAVLLTLEQGKPIGESKIETQVAADRIDWMAEECRRAYGRVIPARSTNVTQLVIKEPVGPVAAFTPWNFPINQAVQKVSAAIAAGCSIILKGPEEAPASCAALVKAFAAAGLPNGVLNLVFGTPSEISDYLIAHPIIKKITFTGSTAVGKQLAAKAGAHMKLITMELGGHAPALIFEDANVDKALKILTENKFRNAGQVCIAPTRFLVHRSRYQEFLSGFIAIAESLPVGNGMDLETKMGPLAHDRRLTAIEGFVSDAVSKGATVETGGKRKGNKGYFYEPTVLTNVALNSQIMNEEPFGPIAPINLFDEIDEVIGEANRLSYGLAAYAYTNSPSTADRVSMEIESGMVSVNHHGIALVETPFGGVQDSGFGKEGGKEGLDSYFNAKFVTHSSV